MFKFNSEGKERMWLIRCLFLLVLILPALKMQAKLEYTYYDVWLNGCKYKVTSCYNTTNRQTSVYATLVEFSLKEGSHFSLPTKVSYTDAWSKQKTASVEYYNESIIRDCDALVTAEVNLKDCYGSKNLFLSNPNLESIAFVGGYYPRSNAYTFVLDCPKLANLGNFANGVMSKTESSKRTLLMYPPAKSDVTFDLSGYDAVNQGAFKGVSCLTEFTATDLTGKDFNIASGALYDKDLTTLIAAVNTPNGIFTLPASVKAIDVFSTAAANLKEFKTEEGSELVAKDGVLYSAAGELIGYPMAKTDNIFVVDEGSINQFAFYFPEKLSILIDLTNSGKSYAKYLKSNTLLLVTDSNIDGAKNYHANSQTVSSFLTDEISNTGSYKAKLALPSGWKSVSVEFPKNNYYIYADAKIAVKENSIEATGLYANSKYEFILTCKDDKDNVLNIPVNFETKEPIKIYNENNVKTGD